MKRIFDRLTRIGLIGHEPLAIKNEVILCNQVAISFSAVIAAGGLMYLSVLNWEGLAWAMLLWVLVLSPVVLNYFHAHQISKGVFVFGYYAMILFISFLTGEPSRIEFGMLLLLGMIHLLYTQYWIRRLSILFCLIGLTACILIYRHSDPILLYPYPWLAQLLNTFGVGLVAYLLFAYYQNMTERKEKRITQTRRKYKVAEEKLQQANEELEQFASVASHDMKEPLRTISSFGRLLEKRIPPEAEAQEFLGYIQDAAKRMSCLLEDLITYARTGNGVKEQTWVDLNDVMMIVQNRYRQKIVQTGAVLELKKLPTLRGDSPMFTQLLGNLLSNSLKYRQTDIIPHIQIAAKQDNEGWCIWVSDNGIGLDSTYNEQIFKPFTRLHALGSFEGSGMGLAICKKIVDRYDGKIWVESEKGSGATFYCHFPMVESTLTMEATLA